MPFQFTCPHCQAKFIVDESYRGRSGSCAECGKPITMPGRASEESQAAAEAADADRREAERRQQRRLGMLLRGLSILGAVAVLVLLVGAYQRWVVPAMDQAQARRDVTASMANLQKVAVALQAYADKYGTYPPPAIRDPSGKSLLSWRVLILPQLGHEDLYRRFNLNEHYSSPTNIELQNSMPAEFRSVGLPSVSIASDTPFTLITGEGTLFPAAGPLSPNDITDDPRTTILLTEGNRTLNLWTSPDDLVFNRAITMSSVANSGVGAGRPYIAAAVSVAGTPLYLPNKLSAQELRGLITPRGDEVSRPPGGAWFDADRAIKFATGQ